GRKAMDLPGRRSPGCRGHGQVPQGRGTCFSTQPLRARLIPQRLQEKRIPMRSLTNLRHLWKKLGRKRRPFSAALHAQLRVEGLETRLVPYSVSGNAWPHPELVTLSFVPDGTNLGGVTSNLQSAFTNKFGSVARWQNEILRAAQ